MSYVPKTHAFLGFIGPHEAIFINTTPRKSKGTLNCLAKFSFQMQENLLHDLGISRRVFHVTQPIRGRYMRSVICLDCRQSSMTSASVLCNLN